MAQPEKAASKQIYFGPFDLYLSSVLVGVYFTLLLLLAGAERNALGLLISGCVSFAVLILSVVLFVIFLYRIWKFAITLSRQAQLVPGLTSPGKAVGFLFIPVFNIFWMFYSFIKLVGTLNRLAEAHHIDTRMSRLWPVSVGMATCLGYVPGIGMIAGSLLGCIVQPVFVYKLVALSRRIEFQNNGWEPPFQEKDLKAASDYRSLFNRKEYGVNYYFAVAFALAYIISHLLLPSWHSVTFGMRGLNLNFGYLAIWGGAGCLLGACLMLLSHSVRNLWLLVFSAGIAGAVVDGTAKILPAVMDGYPFVFWSMPTMNLYFHGFLSAAGFVLAVILAMRWWGVRWWSLPAGLGLMAVLLFYGAGKPLDMSNWGSLPVEILIADIVSACIYGWFFCGASHLYFNHKARSVVNLSHRETSRTDQPQMRIINQEDEGPPWELDPQFITHAFVALTHPHSGYADILSAKIAELNKHSQPRIWQKAFKAKFAIFTAPEDPSGYPDISSIPQALKKLGAKPSSSIVINMLTIAVDQGKTRLQILAGFAYSDTEPKIILPRQDGCAPA